jgi:hypothetical protein
MPRCLSPVDNRMDIEVHASQAEFVAYVDRIWRLIEDDVRASVIEEHA